MSESDLTSQRRQRRQDARQRILDAARTLIEQRPWHMITLDEIMAGAKLTRTAFYRYFDDRELLLIALLEEMGPELSTAGAPWMAGAPEPQRELERNLRALTYVFREHGRLLQAISDAADHDSEIRDAYLGLGDQLVAATEARIRAEIEAGNSAVEDAREVASALVWMNERYLLRCYGRTREADPEIAARALAEVWLATVYGRAPAGQLGSVDPSLPWADPSLP